MDTRKIFILSKIRKAEKYKYHVFSHTWISTFYKFLKPSIQMCACMPHIYDVKAEEIRNPQGAIWKGKNGDSGQWIWSKACYALNTLFWWSPTPYMMKIHQ